MISAEFVHSLNPCLDYTLELLLELLPEPVPLDVAIQSDKVPAEDRVWLLCQPGVLTDVQWDAWLELIISRAVRGHALNCGVETVEAWASQWLSGEDRSESAAWAARDAASAAAAAASAAWAASAAAAAARDAAWAAWAARDAAWAAWAARDAEIAQQIQDALTVLRPKDIRIEVDGG